MLGGAVYLRSLVELGAGIRWAMAAVLMHSMARLATWRDHRYQPLMYECSVAIGQARSKIFGIVAWVFGGWGSPSRLKRAAPPPISSNPPLQSWDLTFVGEPVWTDTGCGIRSTTTLEKPGPTITPKSDGEGGGF